MEILDDPIPVRAYCKAIKRRNQPPAISTEIEAGVDENLDDKPEVASNGVATPQSTQAPQAQLKKKKSDINMTQAVDNSGIWKNMIRKLEAPLQSPRRRAGRFKPTPLDPIIVEEESDLLSPQSPEQIVITAEISGANDDVDTSKSPVIDASGFQVTSV